jgi:hypothetical protein
MKKSGIIIFLLLIIVLFNGRLQSNEKPIYGCHTLELLIRIVNNQGNFISTNVVVYNSSGEVVTSGSSSTSALCGTIYNWGCDVGDDNSSCNTSGALQKNTVYYLAIPAYPCEKFEIYDNSESYGDLYLAFDI